MKFLACGRARSVNVAVAFFFTLAMLLIIPRWTLAQGGNPSPPAEPVRLIFVHHSCGENWLTDGHGDLGRALGANNYFVSDTNYGWGPDGIGDRTDIVDWPEWFTGPNSNRYLSALYAESGQLSSYTRTLPDPGGENRIIMFKSCFPNSNLEGHPNDPPARGGGLTVGNAKAIYNELLTYFGTRPDKLFIAVTAPPVQEPTYGANARAFNTWLVRDWLAGYGGSNVAVFDFYNVLTGPDNHHRFRDGAVEYVTDRGGDTLHYPTNGDDHPSPAGNRKAAEELVPLLNVYYHRWQEETHTAPPPPPPPTSPPEEPTAEPSPTSEEEAPPGGEEAPQPEPPPGPATVGGVIDDFELDAEGWAVFVDTEKDSRLACGRDEAVSYSGTAGLRIEYDIAPESWASCSLVYPAPQDWGGEPGIALYLRGERVGQQVIVIAYQGESPDALLHFDFRAETNQEAVDGWQRVDVPWAQFVQPEWQGDPSVPFDPGQALGLALLFDAPGGGRNSGNLWADDVSFLSAVPPAPAPTEAAAQPVPTEPPAQPAPTEPPPAPAEGAEVSQPAEETEEGEGRGGLCSGSAAFGLITLVGVVWMRRRGPHYRQ